MKKIIATLALIFAASSASADYTMIVPQKVGGGTSVWAEIVAKELEKHLGESIVIDYRPGARDIPGFNDFETTYQHDPKTIMVSHGGNGESFLGETVLYNYANYRPIGMMNLDIIVAKRKGDPLDKIIFSAGSGMTPEAMAIAMLQCGPVSMSETINCWNQKVSWVKGFDGGERRLAFKRGELNATRESPAAYKKHVAPDVNAELWFTHGIASQVGTRLDDPEYPGARFEEVFKAKWGEYPAGEVYEAYKLVRAFRDGFQKALWVGKDNPNADKIIAAMQAMINDPVSRAAIEKNAGNYPWIVGKDAVAHTTNILSLVQEQPLKDLVTFSNEALGLASVYKPELIQ
jgi:hypothetical protein